jgi:hypothetical protein
MYIEPSRAYKALVARTTIQMSNNQQEQDRNETKKGTALAW